MPQPSSAETAPSEGQPSAGGLKIQDFPAEVREVLKNLDDEGDGHLNKKELVDIFTMYGKMQEASKSGNVNLETLPKEIRGVLKVFDEDGGGTISAHELARAAQMYEDSKHQVKRLTRLAAALLAIILLALFAIGVLTYGVIEMSKETTADPNAGVMFVKGSETPVANAAAVKTLNLYEVHTFSTSQLRAVTSLTLSNAANTKTFGYTITGYTKDTALSTVTFVTARGDRIACTASKVTVTAACTPVAPAATCVGAKIVELTKDAVVVSRRRLEEAMSAHAEGRRLMSAAQMRRLQKSTLNMPSVNMPEQGKTTTDASMEPDVCPDGTPLVEGIECSTCDDNMAEVCDDTGCACPTRCPEGEEACYEESGGTYCDDIFFPFKSKPCQPKCKEWREAWSGKCMVQCPGGDPWGSSAPEDEVLTRCPLKCPAPNKTTSPSSLGTDAAYQQDEWVWPSREYPADQALEKLCPKTCPDGSKAWGPDFICPVQCYNYTGGELVDKWGWSVKVWPWPAGKTDEQARKDHCPTRCGTGDLKWPGGDCPFFCIGHDGTEIKEEWSPETKKVFWARWEIRNSSMEEKRKATCPIPCDVIDPETGNLLFVDPMLGRTNCPTLCNVDGNEYLEYDPSGCPKGLVDCPGKPKDCNGDIIMVREDKVQDPDLCPFMCETKRHCQWGQDGLIWTHSPEWEQHCPTKCLNTDGTVMTDDWGHEFLDWGQGCPTKCPSIEATLPSGRRLSTRTFFAWPPNYVCPLGCYDDNGDLMTWPWNANEPITAWPEYWKDQGNGEWGPVIMAPDKARKVLCPKLCPGTTDQFAWPMHDQDGPKEPNIEDCTR
eukprot:TRINITY_DN1985_c0_g1_i2.p1 TRINITY_DN1985_c0_g1~~TRINITY_DN1985_c0_g1_i2.p1  ORF type:complete len:830 (-),score=174.32 TRINITY_DN1985_c0_g1_i2:187-2676(-)